MVLNPDNRVQHAKGSGTKLTSKLDRKQARQLEDWVEKEWPNVEKFRFTIEQIVTQAGHKLGFAITKANVQGAARVMGKTLPRTAKIKKNLIDRIPRQVLVETIRLTAKIGGEMGLVIVPAITQFLKAESDDTTNGTNGNEKADS